MSVEDLRKLVSPKITDDVLQGIIKKKSGLTNAKVVKISIDTASKKGDSYLSTITKFTIDAVGKNAKGEEQSVFIPVFAKALPANVARRKTFRSGEFFENEIIFYEKVWPAMQSFQNSKNIPDKFNNIPLLLSAYWDGTNDYLAMEDLSYEGYEAGDRGEGLNYEATIIFLKTFAQFHGLGLAFKDQQLQAFEKVATALKETYFAERHRGWYTGFQNRLFQVVRDAVEKELPPIYSEHLERLIRNDLFGKVCEISEIRNPLSVITHGDSWVPNFLIKYDSSSKTNKTPLNVVMIDFQLTRYSTLSTDLPFFLFCCVEMPVLEEHWDKLIQEYHTELVNTLEKYGSSRNLVTLEALQNDIKTSSILGIAISMEGLVMTQLNDDEAFDLDVIKGDKSVPLETLFAVKPFQDQRRRQRIATMIKFSVDKGFM